MKIEEKVKKWADYMREILVISDEAEAAERMASKLRIEEKRLAMLAALKSLEHEKKLSHKEDFEDPGWIAFKEKLACKAAVINHVTVQSLNDDDYLRLSENNS